MLAKYWKKIGLVIVIIACVFNVMIKLINKLSLEKEMLTSAQYVYDKNIEEDREKEKNKQMNMQINEYENEENNNEE